MGGLHRFTTWDGPMLTDSGGFQVFSLEGLRTHRRGRRRVPEPHRRDAIARSRPSAPWRSSGSSAPTSRWRSTTSCRGRRRTRPRATGWSARCAGWIGARRRHRAPDAAATRTPGAARRSGPSSRAASTTTCAAGRSRARSSAGPWTGIAIGGLSVGEPKPVMHRVLEALGARPARDTPRYLMGVGFPADLLEGIARGVDLFDCVAATRNGRHGTAWLPTGRVNVRGRRAQGLDRAARPRVRLRDLHHVSARLPPTSVRGRGHAGAPAGLAAQHSFPGPARRAGARRRSWPARSTAGAASGSAATTLAET